MSTIKKVLIAGATGSVGLPIPNALLAKSSFNVTILSRVSSKATFPPSIPVIKVSDAYTVPELTLAFKNQDAVIIALTTSLIDVPGVKRTIPSEYGANNLDPRGLSFIHVYDIKGAILEYLIPKAKERDGKLTWTSISCGSWLDGALDPSKSGNFLGIDLKARKATIYDSGNARFAITTSQNTALAIVRALTNPELTANKQVFLADFVSTAHNMVASLEKQTGKQFEITQKDTASEIKFLREKSAMITNILGCWFIQHRLMGN